MCCSAANIRDHAAKALRVSLRFIMVRASLLQSAAALDLWQDEGYRCALAHRRILERVETPAKKIEMKYANSLTFLGENSGYPSCFFVKTGKKNARQEKRASLPLDGTVKYSGPAQVGSAPLHDAELATTNRSG
jgi:hypothetical protein